MHTTLWPTTLVLALYKSLTYLLTYLLTYKLHLFRYRGGGRRGLFVNEQVSTTVGNLEVSTVWRQRLTTSDSLAVSIERKQMF